MELLTASRMSSMLTCPRKHFWRYEVGLKAKEDGAALRFGSAWHTAMENRWKGRDPEECYELALEGREFDEITLATFSGLLYAYFDRYHQAEEIVAEVHPEIEFDVDLDGSRTFRAAGKIDGLGVLRDGRQALVEHKTTGTDISADSDYWLRLRADSQIFQYVSAARKMGWNIQTVIYDVVRKPMIKPKEIPLLDEAGCKIVTVDATGERATNKNGTPRQSAGEGMTMQTRQESAEEFGERLRKDALERPEFYFARREIPVLDQDLEEFEFNRIQTSRMILDRRRQEKLVSRQERAWPRHVNGLICPFCEYRNFCLQNIQVDINCPPPGFEIAEIHSELTQGKEKAE